MLLKIGQLAKQTCLSIRTLHHYDEIGLLVPSVRSEAGHRLYNLTDVQRLHAIQALKQLGLSLPDIAQALNDSSLSLEQIINRQINQLERDIAQAQTLKNNLQRLRDFSVARNNSDSEIWIHTLALMNISMAHLSADDMESLGQYATLAKNELETDWPQLVSELQQFIVDKISPESADAKQFIVRWIELMERLTGHEAALMLKMHAMTQEEIQLKINRQITPAMIEFLMEAMGALHQDIYAKYLTPEQMQTLRKNQRKNAADWPPLIAELRSLMERGISATDPSVIELAVRWQTLFETSVSGGDAEIHNQLRIAYAQEPLLMQGTGLDQTLLSYIRTALEKISKN